jgi:hypothetical protein
VITYAVAIPVATFLAVQWSVNAQLESARATKPAVPLTAAAGILVLPWAAALVGPAVVIAGIAAVCWALIVAALLRPS